MGRPARRWSLLRRIGFWVFSKETNGKWNEITPNFEGLVLGCIDSYDSNQILIFSGFSRSTRFSHFCTAQISKFQRKTVQFFAGMKMKFHFSFWFFDEFRDFSWRKFDEILPEFHRNGQEMTNCLEIL